MLVAAGMVVLASCTHATPPTTPAASTSPTAPSPPTTLGRVAVIVMENHSYGQIIGNPEAPYLNGLARRSALATSYAAVAHPSLPNYLALIGGDTFGITSDCTTCYVRGPNLVDSLEARHVTWKAFMEGMPTACFTGGSSGRYAKKHDPFMYFDDIRTKHSRCDNVVPLTELDTTHLPDFTWITPDQCDDMHSCSVATGDAFLRRTVPGLLRALGSRGVLFITFDEGTSNQPVVTIAAGDGAKPGRYATPFDHYSLLRTIEEHFGVAPLTGQASTATTMSSLLRSP
jgi:hypothetical protein